MPKPTLFTRLGSLLRKPASVFAAPPAIAAETQAEASDGTNQLQQYQQQHPLVFDQSPASTLSLHGLPPAAPSMGPAKSNVEPARRRQVTSSDGDAPALPPLPPSASVSAALGPVQGKYVQSQQQQQQPLHHASGAKHLLDPRSMRGSTSSRKQLVEAAERLQKQQEQDEQQQQHQEQQPYFAFLKEPSPGTFFSQRKPGANDHALGSALPAAAEMMDFSPTAGEMYFRAGVKLHHKGQHVPFKCVSALSKLLQHHSCYNLMCWFQIHGHT